MRTENAAAFVARVRWSEKTLRRQTNQHVRAEVGDQATLRQLFTILTDGSPRQLYDRTSGSWTAVSSTIAPAAPGRP